MQVKPTLKISPHHKNLIKNKYWKRVRKIIAKIILVLIKSVRHESEEKPSIPLFFPLALT